MIDWDKADMEIGDDGLITWHVRYNLGGSVSRKSRVKTYQLSHDGETQVCEGGEKDSQKLRVYRADYALRAWYEAVSFPNRMLLAYRESNDIRLKASQKFVDDVLKRKYIQRKYPCRPINCIVKPTAYKWAHACGSTIDLPGADGWGFNKIVLLHEIAHVFERRMNGTQWPGHDWPFAAIFLDIVRNVLGKDAGDRLKRYYKDNKVRFRPKRTRTMTVEQKDAAAARIELARAAREKKLAPQRELRDELMALYSKKPRGFVNSFGKMTYHHMVGPLTVDKAPDRMSHADRLKLKNRLAKYEADRKRAAMSPVEREAQDREQARRAEWFQVMRASTFAPRRPTSFVMTSII